MSKFNIGEWIRKGSNIRILDKFTQYSNLDLMGLTHPFYFHLKSDQAGDYNSLKGILNGESKFLVLAFPMNIGSLPRKSKFDVISIEDYIEFYKSINSKNYEFNFIEQVDGVEKGFVGVAISDEKGNVLVECYKKPYETNVYYFTSSLCNPTYISSFLFVNHGDLVLANVGESKPSSRILKNIEEKVDSFFGYFEFIYGKTKRLGERI